MTAFGQEISSQLARKNFIAREASTMQFKAEILVLQKDGKLTGQFIDDNLLVAKAVRLGIVSLLDVFYKAGANMNMRDELSLTPIQIPFSENVHAGALTVKYLGKLPEVDLSLPMPAIEGRFPEAGKTLLDILDCEKEVAANFLATEAFPEAPQVRKSTNGTAMNILMDLRNILRGRLESELAAEKINIEKQRVWVDKHELIGKAAAWSPEI